MEYETEKERVIARPEGDIDIITADTFKSACYKLLDETKLPFFIDCSHINFIDSTGLGAFVSVNKRAMQQGGAITLAALKPTIKKLFTITKLDSIMRFEETL